MPSIITFDNRQVIEPGVYSKIKGGVNNPPVTDTFGAVMIIDTGSGAGYGGGSGINGEQYQSNKSIYQLNNLTDAQKFIGGGVLWDVMNYLWSPASKSNGPQTLYIARANTTVAASATLTFVPGNIVIKAKNEGLRGNGATTVQGSSSILTKGYGMRVTAGINNTSALVVTFYEGQYRGADAGAIEYDAAQSSILSNTVVAKSIEFTTTAKFLAWAQNDFAFNNYFRISSGTASNTALTNTDLVANSGWILYAGGTETYNATDVDSVLSAIADLNVDMFLCDDYGITPLSSPGTAGGNKGAQSVANTKILAHVTSVATYTKKAIYIGGGQDASQFSRVGTSDGSIEIASYYNSELAVVVHSGIQVPITVASSGTNFRTLPSLYHAAMVCGRISGLEPQVPGTYKDLRIKGLVHELTKDQRELALRSGVLHTRYLGQLGWVINQSINTLQKNDYLVYPDGASPEISVMRIIHQINKTLQINATPMFIGGNINTVSPADIKAFVIGYLSSITATRENDNLIITFQNVSVTLTGTVYNVSYCVVANGPVNRIFTTGTIIDPTISI